MSALSDEFILDGPRPGPFTVAQNGLDGMSSGDRRLYIEKAVRENLGWLRGWFRGHVRSADEADDLCQESFLKALEHLSELRDSGRFYSWLHCIAVNTLRDHFRSEVRRKAWVVKSDHLEEIQAPSLGADPDTAEEAERLLEAIRALPQKLREPLLLRHSRDLSYKEIGAILGLRENAVQVRIFRARKMLREKLGPSVSGSGEPSPRGKKDENCAEVDAPSIDRGPTP